MRKLTWLVAAFVMMVIGQASAVAADRPISVVAAENFYGDVARQIGGARVAVSSILNNPDQDPHLFETSPSIVREIAAAHVIIANGADYDPWMDKLLKATPSPSRVVIVAADLMHKTAGDNPHLWYDPATMPAVASALADAFIAADRAHADFYAARLKSFIASLDPINRKIAAIRNKYSGAAVTATEPVFGYMADALHLTMRNQRLQLAIMNDTEPSASDVAAFEHDIASHAVRAVFYNKQAPDAIVRRFIELAHAANIPVLAVTETCPPGLSYQEWVLGELDKTATALAGPSS